MPDEKGKIISNEGIMKLLDTCYEKSVNGIPMVSASVEELANDYLNKYDNKEQAAKALIKNQIIKCATSGFLTSFGGVITLPVTLPANIGSVLYVQMRMISAVAYMSGLEINCDQTQTFVYACLAGVSVNEIIKQAGIKFGTKFSTSLVKKIPGKTLTKINQKVGFRFITKFGEKGIVNLGKMVPAVGAVIGGSLDFVETKAIGNRAFNWFFKNEFENKDDENVIELSEEEYEIESNENNNSSFNINAIKDSATKEIKNVGAGLSKKLNKLKNTIGNINFNSSDDFDKSVEQLEKLAKLKESGIISEEEFNAKKKELLRDI